MNRIHLVLGLLAAAAVFYAVQFFTSGSMTLNKTQPAPPPTGDSYFDSKVALLAAGIARAEGYGPEGNIPTRANNPGDIEAGDVGYGTLGEGITVYDSPAAGWLKLYRTVTGWLKGTSKVYFPSDSLRDVARKYVNGPLAAESYESQSWAGNVTSVIGGTIDDTLQDFLGR